MYRIQAETVQARGTVCVKTVSGIVWLCLKSLKGRVSGTSHKMTPEKHTGLGSCRALDNMVRPWDFIPSSVECLLRILSKKTTRSVFHFRKITFHFMETG